jgi:hypothetical protein
VEIGTIKGWDFSGNYIHKNGTKILGITKTEMKFQLTNNLYGCIGLSDKDGAGHQLSVHKIINQVLKGGKYEDGMDHKDKVRNNNSIGNLEAVSSKENMIRAVGKSVKQIDVETGNDISRACNNNQTVYGYKWEWCRIYREELLKKASGKAVKQINIETGEIIKNFRCVDEATKKLGKKRGGYISGACNGRYKNAYGYKWEWC